MSDKIQVADPQRPVFTPFTLESTMPVASDIGSFTSVRTTANVNSLRTVRAAKGNQSIYDPDVADVLAYVSTWAYAEPPEFAFMMTRRGFITDPRLGDWHYLIMRITNDPAFVVATVYLVQSPDCSLGILCFRGTEPVNVINWLTDLTVSPEPFLQGTVHGGIFRNMQAIWPLVDKGLALLNWGQPISVEQANVSLKLNPSSVETQAALKPYRPGTLKHLYICGHSLGAAMAALSAANIYANSTYNVLIPAFRGAYTYGSPMVASPDLADQLDASMGDLVYRHVYAHDVVPRLPPLSTGRFKHFGREYRSAVASKGWSYSPSPVTQSGSVTSLAIAGLDLVAQQFPFLRSFVSLPYSVDAHSPRYYLAASESSLSSTLDGLDGEWQVTATNGARANGNGSTGDSAPMFPGGGA